MKADIQQLYELSNKQEKIIVGLMSGTSLDGLDIAACNIKGSGLSTQVEVLHFETVPYDEMYKQNILEVFSKPGIETLRLTLLNKQIAKRSSEHILRFIDKHGITNVDCIASHGQTIFHAPTHLHKDVDAGTATLQIGDGDIIAKATGILTISDFRQKHIAAGGDGAPLAPYADAILYGSKYPNLILLNIGGIANFSYFNHGRLMAYGDSGPGNKLMDLVAGQANLQNNYDKNGDFAARGIIHPQLLGLLHQHPYLKQPHPKSTGPETFSQAFISRALQQVQPAVISDEDLMATLNRFTAETIANDINSVAGSTTDLKVIVTGGGLHNKTLMQHLATLIKGMIIDDAPHTIHPDAKEAVLMALLANETLSGNIEEEMYVNGCLLPVSMGKICLPH